ncbi:MAG: hypothetical protein HYZ13_00410 [Acidobacteria bacterium]|nr:hypothetical protein [Acidobacteriota bacterium]
MAILGFAGRSIRAKLLAVVMITTCTALLLSGAALVLYDAQAFKRQKLFELTGQAHMIGAISSAALSFDDPKAAREYLQTLSARPGIQLGAIYDASGKVFAEYQSKGGLAAPTRLEMRDDSGMVEDDLVVTTTIRQGSEMLGAVHLRSSLSQRTRLRNYGGIVLLLSALALGATLLLSGRLQSLISLPLLEVAHVARGVIERQDFSLRVAKRSHDEVGVLVDAFNEMLALIQRRELQLRQANQALQLEITEHKAAREEVAALNQGLEARVAERTAELEILNRELESFSYSVSHDLRAPLRSIDGFTAILQKTYGGSLDESGRAYMDRVRGATQRMGTLIDDLLTLSRTSRSAMIRRQVDLSQLAESILHDLREGAPERRVDLHITPGLRVEADPTLLRTALENLLGNAWKFTSRKEVARIEVGLESGQGGGTYFVRDNGAGFDMKYVDKIFAPFQRLHSSTEFEGTGIGLANVQRIVRRHGGELWCEAEVGRGATFYFTFPP